MHFAVVGLASVCICSGLVSWRELGWAPSMKKAHLNVDKLKIKKKKKKTNNISSNAFENMAELRACVRGYVRSLWLCLRACQCNRKYQTILHQMSQKATRIRYHVCTLVGIFGFGDAAVLGCNDFVDESADALQLSATFFGEFGQREAWMCRQRWALGLRFNEEKVGRQEFGPANTP